MTRKTLTQLLLLMVVIGCLLGGCLAKAEKAQATDICSYLDAHPTVAGVEDLVGIGITINGMSPYETGAFIRDVVDNECPRHLVTIQMYLDKWNPGATVGGGSTYAA